MKNNFKILDKIVFVIKCFDDGTVPFVKKWLTKWHKFQGNFVFVFTRTIPEETKKEVFSQLGMNLESMISTEPEGCESNFGQIIEHPIPSPTDGENVKELLKILSFASSHRIRV